MKKNYRTGAIGALMDEYERAVMELARLVERISEEDFMRVVDPETQDEACRSAQTILSHVVRAGYGYADYIREKFSLTSTSPPRKTLSHQETLEQLAAVLSYTEKTLDGHWGMTDEDINSVVIQSRWGVTYDLEQLLEHAIVHVLRHRRQIDKFMQQGLIATQ